MGPIRRRLTLAFLTLIPTQAFAQACEAVRPGWDGEPVTALGEAIALFSTPPSLLLLIATAFVVRLKAMWGGLAVVVGWAAWISILDSPVVFPDNAAAAIEGCIGPDTLFIALAIAICALIVIFTSPRRAADKNGEN